MVVRHASAPRPPDGAGRGEGEDKATTGGIALCGVSRGQLGVRLSASTGRAASRVEEGGGGEAADKTAREDQHSRGSVRRAEGGGVPGCLNGQGGHTVLAGDDQAIDCQELPPTRGAILRSRASPSPPSPAAPFHFSPRTSPSSPSQTRSSDSHSRLHGSVHTTHSITLG